MHPNYKLDEKILKDIISTNVKCNKEGEHLKITFYYINKKTSNLVIKNSPKSESEPLDMTNVIYKFQCKFMQCNAEYIGHTRTSLKKRLNNHYYKGSIKNHYQLDHNQKITKEELYNNTKIMGYENEYRRLIIKEALEILEHLPAINIQDENFHNILKLYKNNNINRNQEQSLNMPNNHAHVNQIQIIGLSTSQAHTTAGQPAPPDRDRPSEDHTGPHAQDIGLITTHNVPNLDTQNLSQITRQAIGLSTPQANTTRQPETPGRDRPNKDNIMRNSPGIGLVNTTPYRHAVSPGIVSRVTSLQNRNIQGPTTS